MCKSLAKIAGLAFVGFVGCKCAQLVMATNQTLKEADTLREITSWSPLNVDFIMRESTLQWFRSMNLFAFLDYQRKVINQLQFILEKVQEKDPTYVYMMFTYGSSLEQFITEVKTSDPSRNFTHDDLMVWVQNMEDSVLAFRRACIAEAFDSIFHARPFNGKTITSSMFLKMRSDIIAVGKGEFR